MKKAILQGFFQFLTVIFVCVFFTLKLNAQSYNFNNYTVDKGLSQSVILDLMQDSEGYIWVATQDGLNKFNGYTFEQYIHNPLDTNSLSNNWIYSIIEDSENIIWISTRKGINKFNKKNNNFQRLNSTKKNYTNHNNEAIYGIALTKTGKIAQNSLPTLTLFNPKTKKTEIYKNNFAKTPPEKDYSIPIIVDNDGLIWIGTKDGLSCFDETTKKFVNYTHSMTDNSSISDNNITALFEDKKGNIWIGTLNGLNKLDKKSKKFIRFYNNTDDKYSLSGNSIRAILQDDKGFLWIGTESSGLNKVSIIGERLESMRFQYISEINSAGISHDIVLSLLKDKSNNLWIGTLNGLDKTDLKNKKFNLFRKTNDKNSLDLIDNVIAGIYQTKQKDLWIGNWGKGLNIWHKKNGIVEHFSTLISGKNHIENDYVQVIFEYNPHEIWIGTRGGVFVFDLKSNSFVTLNNYYKTKDFPDFKNNRIYCLSKDKNNGVWLGTQNGLYFLDLKTKTYKYYSTTEGEFKISDNLIYSIIIDKENLLWIGTTNGLDKVDLKTNKISKYKRNIALSNSVCDDFIVSLFEDSDGSIWIGTKSGLNNFTKKDSIFKYYSIKDGLLSNIIYEIKEDNSQNIWFATGKGIAFFDKKTKKFRNFGVEDGLQSLEFNLKACYKTQDGEMFFGGMNGFNSFYPDSIKDNPYLPNVVFTSISKVNKTGKHQVSLNKNKGIEISYSDYELTIEFAGLEFTNPEKNQYAYKMEGIADEWIEIGSRRFVPFPNLTEGKYVFHVKASNNDGIWNETGNKIIIIVTPPWYRTILAYVSYIILVILLIFNFIKYRERKLKKEKAVLEKKVQERTLEIELQKEEIEAQSENLKSANEELLSLNQVLEFHRQEEVFKNKEITDSIQYAKRIQSAVLPDDENISSLLSEYFIFNKPKDIVSGDFYFVQKVNDYLILAVADCTGHGVPGAFMSMLGVSLLNEIIRKEDTTSASQVLDLLREQIKISLKQTGKMMEQKDGMDIVFCSINVKTGKIQFAGANNSLYVVRNSSEVLFVDNKPVLERFQHVGKEANLYEIKSDYQPIGIFVREIPFTLHEFQLQTGDVLYLCSDGFEDQYGGENDRKYMSKNLKKLLLEISQLPLSDQKELLNEALISWMGNKIAQVDDILIFGIKIPEKFD